MVHADVDDEALLAPVTLRRSSSDSSLCSPTPGSGRRHHFDASSPRKQLFQGTQQTLETRKRRALEQNFDVLDAMVKLDFRASQLRRGGTFNATMSYPSLSQCDEKAKPFECTVVHVDNETCQPNLRSSSAIGSKSQICKDNSLPKLLKVPSAPILVKAVDKVVTTKVRKNKFVKAVTATIGHARQLQALTALLLSLDKGGPLEELLSSATRHVLMHFGTKAFTEAQCKQAVAIALADRRLSQEPTLVDGAQARSELLVLGLQTVSEMVGMPFVDVVGQLLWKNRKSECLQRKRYKDAVGDLNWAMSSQDDDQAKRTEQLLDVDDAFKMFSAENGRMNSRGWRQVARLVWSSPMLADRLNLSDVDRLWYAQTRTSASKEVRRDIDSNDFKELLLALAESMRVPPWMVFFPVGSFAHQSPMPSPLPSPIGTPLVSPQPSSRGVNNNKLTLPATQSTSRPTSPSPESKMTLVA